MLAAVDKLRRAPAFAELDDEAIRALTRDAEVLEIGSASPLLEQGTVPSHLHVLVEGRVGLTMGDAGGAATILDVVEPVELLFLAAVLRDVPTLMGARTLARSSLLLVPAAGFRQSLAEAPRLGMAMLASMAGQYRFLVRQVKNLKLRSAAQRLGCHLLDLARLQGAERLRLPYDKRVLAAQLGATPEHLSRAFATLRAHGVETRGSMVHISDAAALAAFAAPDPPAG